MRRSKIELYVHLVWATWRREPYLLPAVERSVYRSIEQEAIKTGALILAMNGTTDHVHVLAKIPATIAVAHLMNQMKGVSSRFVHDQLPDCGHFRWQENYGAFSVGRSQVKRVREYVMAQKAHHTSNTLHAAWEETDEEADA
jgi:REP element-mobilizing transposase RayT